MAEFHVLSDQFFRGGDGSPRMLWVYGLGQRDLSGCLPGDINCVGKERTYSLAGIENAKQQNQLIVSSL